MHFARVFHCFRILAPLALVSLAAPITAADPPQAVIPEHVSQSAGPRLSLEPSAPAQPAETLFWMVNSYQAAQHRLECNCGPLIYQQRTRDGWRTATAGGFQEQFVPGVPVAIIVHGSFVEWQTQYVHAEATYEWLRSAAPERPLHIVFYNWPSGGPYTRIFGVDVAVRGTRAEFNAFHLVHVMSMIPEESPICLVGHSHGARTVLASLHLRSGGEIQDLVYTGCQGGPRRLRAILLAAAVDHDWLRPGERYDRALWNADVINFKNRCDLPLNLYPLVRPFGRPSLATVGFTDGDRQELGPLGWRAVDVDVSRVIGEAHTWPNYLQSPVIASLLMQYLQFDDERAAPLETAPVSMTWPLEFDD